MAILVYAHTRLSFQIIFPTDFYIPPDVLFECQDCVQSFLNSGFEDPVLPGNWAYLNEDGTRWNTTSSTNIVSSKRAGRSMVLYPIRKSAC